VVGLRLVQKTLLDERMGEFDDLTVSKAGRLNAAEITLRVSERAGLLAVLPQAPAQARTIDWDALTLEEKEAFMRDQLRARKGTP
jgi:hypothetical protein